MNDVIVIDLLGNTLQANAYIIKNGTQSVTKINAEVPIVAETAVSLAYGEQIFRLQLSAPKDMQQTLSNLIKQSEKKQYSENKIKVECI